jgi:hypothetical protein
MFELGKGMFDWVWVGGAFWQEEQLGTGGAGEPADRFALVTAEVIHDHDVAGAQRRDQDLFDIDLEGLAVDRPSSSHGAAIRS